MPCPACDQVEAHPVFLSRAPVPTLQNTTLASREAAIRFPHGALSFAQCQNCSFVWNVAFDESLICYDETYNNDVSSSTYYRQHLEERADAIIASVPEDVPIHYVEIGCGNADFLRLVIERASGRVATALGFDPSFSSSIPLPQNAKVYREHFSSKSRAKIPAMANVICSRHTIEHIAAPRKFAEGLSAIIQREDQKLFVETPTVDWIFENTAFYDFFYEHCTLFNAHSLQRMFADFEVTGIVGTVYGGQYLWAELHRGSVQLSDSSVLPGSRELAAKFVSECSVLTAHWVNAVANKKPGARIGIWGAASKGVTFALIMNQAGQKIDFAIDLNKDKQGCYTPLTGIRIERPELVRLTNEDTVIVVNPNYLQEIRNEIAAMGADPRVSCL